MGDQTPLEKVLALRPTNVVSRFGAHSRLPLLNPRDISAALEATGAGLASFPAYAPHAIGGILRAARDDDAPVGICCPWPLPVRDGPRRFVDAVKAAAEEVRHRKPLFLQAGPVTLSGADDAEAVHPFIEAGFTSVALDASALDDPADAYQAAVQPLSERELSVEIAAPLDTDGRADPQALRVLLERLAATGALVQSVRVPVQAVSTETWPHEPWQMDHEALSRLVAVARAHGAALTIVDEGVSSTGLAPAWIEAGARRAEVRGLLARVLERLLGGARLAWEPGTVDPKAGLKLEALTWAAVSDVFGAVKAKGTAARVVMYLARGGRY